MSTQSEAILENNLIKQLMCLGYAVIKINNAEALESFLKSQLEAIKRLVAAAICLRLKMEKRNKMLKTYLDTKIYVNFVLLKGIANASSSYRLDCFLTQDNTPPMPLIDAHLGGLFFTANE